MKTLELYINGEKGGFHTFLEVEGARRFALEGSFSSQSVDEMLAKAVELLDGDNGYESRLRIYDCGRKMLKSGEVTAWVTLKQLRLWTRPKGTSEPQVNEDILGKPTAATA